MKQKINLIWKVVCGSLYVTNVPQRMHFMQYYIITYLYTYMYNIFIETK